MTVRSLESVSSFERGLGSACTALRFGDGNLLAGSQEGALACWSVDSGDELWRVEVDGPISDLVLEGNRVYAAASSDLHVFDVDDGEIVWSRALEGASDYVRVHDGIVWASSSVYEIEISDYTESTVWMFDSSGSLQQRWTFSERAWHLGLHNDGGVLLGLGRPRCGYLRIRRGEDAEHHDLTSGSPVTIGACGSDGRFLIGHSDGSVSVLSESGEVPGEVKSTQVRAICSSERNWFSGHHSGEVVSSRGWVVSAPGAVQSLAFGPGASDGNGIWTPRWGDDVSRVAVLDAADGSTALELEHPHRIRHIQSAGEIVALGDSEGRIHLIEKEVLSRRLGTDGDSDDDERRGQLMARLRQLREA